MNLKPVMPFGLNQRKRKNTKEIMEKDNKSCTLPHDLMLEIMMRLSVKSLIRFKCVCKPWNSLISNPNFAKLHFDQSLTPPSHKLIYLPHSDYSEPRSIDLDASLHQDSSVAPLSPVFETYLYGTLQGSCRGFLLLGGHFPHLILWNPATGTHKTIPYPLNLKKIRVVSSKQDGCRIGFGYDMAKDDYLVVLAFFSTYSGSKVTPTCTEIFSVRTNSWKEIQDVTSPCAVSSYPSRSHGLYFNGVIHWIFYNDGVIVCFDLGLRKFSEMDLPHRLRPGGDSGLMIVRGCLAVSDGGVNEIWIMKEYKVQSSWVKYCDVRRDVVPFLGCHNNDGDIIGLRGNSGELVKFNYKGELIESALCGHITILERTCYRESLLLLPWNSGELSKSREDQH